jgi:fibronectin-binding autotransporter adhesin
LKEFSASGLQSGKARVDRCWLKLGTVLGSGALATALLVPVAAHAADSSAGFQVSAPMTQGTASSPVEFQTAAADTTPQDLTVVRPLQRLSGTVSGGVYSYGNITTTSNNTPGVSTSYAGATTITAGNITTSGNYSAGVSAYSQGPISIKVGNVSTSGTNSNGIYARTIGDLTVTAGSISTTGTGAAGIYTSSAGNTVINAGDITTSGNGVQASAAGQVSVTVGNVTSGGTGINAFAGGNINITATSVTSTTGTGINAYSSGGNVVIKAGNVYATGGHYVMGVSAVGQNVTVTTGNVVGGLAGVYARAYDPYNPNDHSGAVNVTVNGDVSVTADIAHGVTADSDGTVNITTTGEISSTSLGFRGLPLPGAGIWALGYGDVTVNAAGRIKTYGEATGIYGRSYHGDVTINASAINTYGEGSSGIRAWAQNGAATVVAGDITLSGASSTGIQAVGGSVNYSTGAPVLEAGSVDVTLNGQIQANTNTSNGIVATAYDGNVAVHNNGSITIGNLGGFGIRATAYGTGNVVVDGQGSVTTGHAQGGYGVVAVTQSGSISVTQGAIQSGHYGVLAIANNTYGDKAANGISINVGSVSTTGTGQTATGIAAVDYNLGSTVTINANSITTIGDYASGISTIARNGDVTITGGSISTRGKAAWGVIMDNAISEAYATVSLQSVTTTGMDATGVGIIEGTGGGVNVKVGSVSTAGDYAVGVLAYTGGATTIQVGSVTTAGKQSLGVYDVGASGVTLNVGSISTAGDEAIGILAKSATSLSITETGGITTQGADASGVIAITGAGPIDLTLTGAISTKGGNSAGAVAEDGNGAVTVQAGTISTAGAGSPALAVYSDLGTASVNIASASTAGLKSPAVLIDGQTGVTITASQITTSGDNANALIVRSGGYGVIGNATVNVGSITTNGQQSAGIDAFTVGSTGPSQASTLSIKVGSITTTGLDSPGISAIDSYGAININASNISTQGAESTGMLVFGGSDINIQAGSISTTGANAIYANGSGSGTITIGVSGKVASSGSNGIVAINAAGATNISVASTGSVSGAADAIQVQTGSGQVTIANAGTITGGSGYAIDVTALTQSTPTGSTQITNTGTIVGAVNLANGGTLTNSGTFTATKDSDFGGGTFVNTGVLQIGASAPSTVSFLNLATFENAGGLIDLRNAPVGEVFTLSGDYAASGDARLGLGLSGNTADKLVVLGTATGATSILLGVNAANATLLAKPLTLVQAGAGSTANFTLSNPNVGLIHYGLQTVSSGAGAQVDYQLTASAGAPVYGMLKLEESVQNVWRLSADAWSEHLAAMRGDAWGGGSGGGGSASSSGTGRYWVQAYGSTSERDETVSTGYGGVSVNYSQTDAGVQLGADVARTATRLGNVVWGVTAGYTSSNVDALGGTLTSDIETFNVGGYGVLTHGAYFANGLVKFDRSQISTTDNAAGFSANLNGDSYGAQFEFGRHFGSERFAFEPVVSLSYVQTSLDAVSIYNQNLSFDDESGLSGKIGGRVYANRTLAGTSFVFYAGAAAVDDFTGDQRATFYSGGTSQNVSADGEGAYGQAVVGVSARTARNVTLYLEGEGNFGGSYSGAGVRFGARF